MLVGQMTSSVDKTLQWPIAFWPNDKFCWPNIASIKCLKSKWQVLLEKHCVNQINACYPNEKLCLLSTLSSIQTSVGQMFFDQAWLLLWNWTKNLVCLSRCESWITATKVLKSKSWKEICFFVFRIKNKVYCQSDSSTKHDNFHQALYYGATTFIITTFSIVSDTQHNRLNCDTEHWRHLLRSVLLCSVTHFLIDMLRVIILNAVMLSVVGPV
jgi:hypothetical protein